MASEQGGGIGEKVMTMVGAKVARTGVTKGWKVATGSEPPIPEDPENEFVLSTAWVAVSAAAVAVVQLLIRRRLVARSLAKPQD